MTRRRPQATPTEKPRQRVSLSALAAASGRDAPAVNAWSIPKPLPGVLPSPDMAMDSYDAGLNGMLNYAANSYGGSAELHFLGMPYLAELSVKPEFRRMASVIGQECTRKWVKIVSTGDGDKADVIAKIEAAMQKFRVRQVMHQAMVADSLFGASYIYLDTGATDARDELKTPLRLTNTKLTRGGLKGIRTVDPMFIYPGASYDSTNPLSPHFYRPQTWYCQGIEIHRSRLLQVVSRPVANILKPVFLFNGLSLSQMALPYISNFIRTRKSVSDLLHSFTTFVLSSNLSATLTGGDGSDISERAALFAKYRDNKGILVVDKDTESLDNVSAPLAGLEGLLSQSLEQCGSICGIPLCKLLGVEPEGLNSSTEGTMQSFYDMISAMQEHALNDHLETILHAIQLHLFGTIDESIVAEWQPMEEANETEMATNEKTRADTAVALINAGVISPDEYRQRLAADPESGYQNLDLSIEIDPPAPEPPEDDPTDAPQQTPAHH